MNRPRADGGQNPSWVKDLIATGRASAADVRNSVGTEVMKLLLDNEIVRQAQDSDGADILVAQSVWMLARRAVIDKWPSIPERLRFNEHVMDRVASYALGQRPLPPGDSTIYVDIGSSFIPLVQHLLDSLDNRRDIPLLYLITASLPVAMEVLLHRNKFRVDLRIIGGSYSHRHYATGPLSEEEITPQCGIPGMYFDRAYIGAAAIVPSSNYEINLYTDTTDADAIKRWAMARSREVYILADLGKFPSDPDKGVRRRLCTSIGRTSDDPVFRPRLGRPDAVASIFSDECPQPFKLGVPDWATVVFELPVTANELTKCQSTSL